MKLKLTSKLLFVALATIFFGFFTACKSTVEPQPELGYLTVYNFSPSLATYDIYVGGGKRNTAPIPYGGGVIYAQYLVGKYSVAFNEAGSSTQVFKQDNIDVVRYQFNTFFLTGRVGQQEGIVLKDEFSMKPEAGKAYVRFINLSPDAGSVNFSIKDSAALATNKIYKSYTDFVPVDTKSTTFEVKDQVNNAVLALTDASKLQERYYYTVVFGGLANAWANERGLSATLITQK